MVELKTRVNLKQVQTDADIRDDLTCAGREASIGSDVIVGLYGRFPFGQHWVMNRSATERSTPARKSTAETQPARYPQRSEAAEVRPTSEPVFRDTEV